MRNKSLSLSLLVLFLAICRTAAGSSLEIRAINSDGISSGIVNSSSQYYVIRECKKLSLECVLKGLDVDSDEHVDVVWMDPQSKSISPSGGRIDTDFEDTYNTETRERTLYFMPLQLADSGWYSCTAMFEDGMPLTKHVQIKVIGAPHWRTKSDFVSGNIGESLSIDCGADGLSNTSSVSVLDEHGQAINESLGFPVAGTEVTIVNLTVHHQGIVIRCLAIEPLYLGHASATNETRIVITTQKEISVDVTYPPVFSKAKRKHYAVVGHNVSLKCSVIKSNPPVNKFLFMKAGKEVLGDARHFYELLDQETAKLNIIDVEEEDFGRYTCKAFNGKLHSEYNIVLEETRPPKQPKVTLRSVSNDSITWHIENNQDEGSLLVRTYSISFRPLRLTHSKVQILNDSEEDFADLVEDQEEEDDKSELFRRNATNLYQVSHLKPYVEYEFTFAARNEVGEGDPITLKASTGTEHIHYTEFSSDASKLIISPIFFAILFLRILLFV